MKIILNYHAYIYHVNIYIVCIYMHTYTQINLMHFSYKNFYFVYVQL